MTPDLDYATPQHPPGRSAIRLVPLVLVTAIIALTLSMGFWSRQFTGWSSPGRFSIDAVRTEWGFPRWLAVVRVRSSGAAPPINSPSLPAAGGFQPGLHVAPVPLCLSLAACLAAGLVACAIGRGLRRRAPPPGRGRFAWIAPVAVAAIGLAAGWVSLTATDPQNVLLTFVAIPLAVFVGAFVLRTYAGGVLAAAAATAAYWWAARMARLPTATDGRFDPDETLAMALMFLITLAVAAAAAFLAKRRAPGRDVTALRG